MLASTSTANDVPVLGRSGLHAPPGDWRGCHFWHSELDYSRLLHLPGLSQPVGTGYW